MTIREMTMDDIEEIAALETANSLTPWNETSLFTYFLRDDTLLAVGEENDKIIGFAALMMAPPEADILDITIDSEFRRHGYGAELLSSLMEMAKNRGTDTIFLEVRVSNTPARRLYEKLGFTETGIRKNYYTDPSEDGISMKAVLSH